MSLADFVPTPKFGECKEQFREIYKLERAWKLADHIMTQPRTTRRLTTQIIRRLWRQRISDDLDGGFGIQMFSHLAKKKSIHSRDHIGSSIAYVREGKENNIK